MRILAKYLLVGLALLGVALAAGNKATLTISSPVTVNGKTLAAGEYQVVWSGNAPDVNLNILKDGKVVASAPAHLNRLKSASPYDTHDLKRETDGSQSLTALRFAGKKYSLSLGESESQRGAQAGSK